VKSWGDELARQIDMRIHPSVADLAHLDAIPPEDRPNGIVCTVEADQSQWQFLQGSNAPAAPGARVPADSPPLGRWHLVGANLGQTLGGGSVLVPLTCRVTIAVAQFASLAAGVKSTRVPLGPALPPGGRPFAREVVLGAAFSGGGAASVTLDVGGTSPSDIIAGQSIFTGALGAMAGTSGVNPTGDHGGQQLQVTITADVDLNQLTAGSVTVVVFHALLP
jgi:hypothetical protein